MRSEEEIITLILQIAESNEHIRAVLLTGSRVNPNTKKDKLQDFDIIYFITKLGIFIQDHSWIDVFGERLIMQLPDEMTVGNRDEHAFHYLMLFTDYNRIDLSLFPVCGLPNLLKQESQLKVLLDKDGRLKMQPLPERESYGIKQPKEKEFQDCCNEFWWVSTYVAKGLLRNEVIYAKEILDGPVRAMFLQIQEWYIGILTSFTVSLGKSGRHIQHYLFQQLYNQILATYPDSNTENIWQTLFLMTKLFEELTNEVASAMHLYYHKEEVLNVMNYLKHIHVMPKE